MSVVDAAIEPFEGTEHRDVNPNNLNNSANDPTYGENLRDFTELFAEELAELPFSFVDDIADILEIKPKKNSAPRGRKRWRGRRRNRTQATKEQTDNSPKQRPNYFVSIPITNKQLLDKIGDVQKSLVKKEKQLQRALIPLEKLHLTVIVATLRTEEAVQRAVNALQQCRRKVDEILQGRLPKMIFHGIDQFNNKVCYVKMTANEQPTLHQVAEAIKTSFETVDVDIAGSKEFKPHLTILKLSKAPTLRRMRLKKILYEEYEDAAFGTELFTRIDLCSMHKKQASGYYHCESSILLASCDGETREVDSGSKESASASTAVPFTGEMDSKNALDQCLQSVGNYSANESSIKQAVDCRDTADHMSKTDKMDSWPGATGNKNDKISVGPAEVCCKEGASANKVTDEGNKQ
ncbi:A-kinase anchor protein 7-like [Acipenser oxyrinchus oxyrinchus]|uniref:A-kinase anchor protein 7-like n=1 Tax=Acipenser oxyrinchus oxyrinchus TaxID=40147 RepID=A0AAD8GEC1_ACIOX|nr:A-kinase anchor protein 7-like [Acipenser oxyrinchus oxyrinchus]